MKIEPRENFLLCGIFFEIKVQTGQNPQPNFTNTFLTYPRWKVSCVSRCSREIHDIHTPNHMDITRNAHPWACNNSAHYTCT